MPRIPWYTCDNWTSPITLLPCSFSKSFISAPTFSAFTLNLSFIIPMMRDFFEKLMEKGFRGYENPER
jgi:hypothetical protein